MSDVEQGYAERYHSLVIKHFQNSVTGNIPERLGRLDEDEMGTVSSFSFWLLKMRTLFTHCKSSDIHPFCPTGILLTLSFFFF